jgi:hypothetical protein
MFKFCPSPAEKVWTIDRESGDLRMRKSGRNWRKAAALLVMGGLGVVSIFSLFGGSQHVVFDARGHQPYSAPHHASGYGSFIRHGWR